jgi:hypothetical protein
LEVKGWKVETKKEKKLFANRFQLVGSFILPFSFISFVVLLGLFSSVQTTSIVACPIPPLRNSSPIIALMEHSSFVLA